MFNPEFSIFNDWMFGKLNDLLSNTNQPKDLEGELTQADLKEPGPACTLSLFG